MPDSFSGIATQVISTGSSKAQPKGDINESEEPRDLGFGAEVARKSRRRLLNQDGSFNVRRQGYSFVRSRSLYHSLLNSSWPQFFALVVASYVLMNLIFAILFYCCGAEALRGTSGTSAGGRFADCFFFSVQTFATLGFGGITPHGLWANLLVTAETLIGLLGFALATGLLFSRISRPKAQIIFSKQAAIAPYQKITAFEFRIANARKNQITHLEARVVMSRLEHDGNNVKRRFYDLPLERKQVLFFPLHWTIVHPISEQSPLFNTSESSLKQSDTEILVLLTGTDDTFSQTVNCWSSYKDEDIIWDKKFVNILEELEDGTIGIDLNRIHDLESTLQD